VLLQKESLTGQFVLSWGGSFSFLGYDLRAVIWRLGLNERCRLVRSASSIKKNSPEVIRGRLRSVLTRILTQSGDSSTPFSKKERTSFWKRRRSNSVVLMTNSTTDRNSTFSPDVFLDG